MFFLISCFTTDLKLIFSRILPMASDSDPVSQKSFKTIYSTLHVLNPDIFWACWGSAKLSDRKHVNILYGSRDISADKKELLSIKSVLEFFWILMSI